MKKRSSRLYFMAIVIVTLLLGMSLSGCNNDTVSTDIDEIKSTTAILEDIIQQSIARLETKYSETFEIISFEKKNIQAYINTGWDEYIFTIVSNENPDLPFHANARVSNLKDTDYIFYDTYIQRIIDREYKDYMWEQLEVVFDGNAYGFFRLQVDGDMENEIAQYKAGTLNINEIYIANPERFAPRVSVHCYADINSDNMEEYMNKAYQVFECCRNMETGVLALDVCFIDTQAIEKYEVDKTLYYNMDVNGVKDMTNALKHDGYLTHMGVLSAIDHNNIHVKTYEEFIDLFTK